MFALLYEKIISFPHCFSAFIVTLALLVNATGCANIIPPTGGTEIHFLRFL